MNEEEFRKKFNDLVRGAGDPPAELRARLGQLAAETQRHQEETRRAVEDTRAAIDRLTLMLHLALIRI